MPEPGEPTRASPGNVFTNKIGPLPMIAWVGIVGAVIIGWAYLKNRGSSSTSSTAGDGSTPASDVPQFVNQTYTTVTAPTVEQPQTQTGTIPMGPGEGGPPPSLVIPGPPGGGSFHPPHPKPPPRKPGGGGEPIFNATYVVKPGDTLDKVAKKYRITREQLAHANGFGTGAGLRTGQKLRVPSPAGTGAPNKAP